MKFSHQEMANRFIPQSQSSLGFLGIYRESIKTTTRNWNLLLPIFLLAFLSLSHIEFAQDYIQIPLLKDFMLHLLQHQRSTLLNLGRKLDSIAYRGALDDILEIVFIKQLTMAISSIIKLLFIVATVSSSYEAYTFKSLSPKDLFLKIKTRWRNTLVTSLCMVLIYSVIVFVYLASYSIPNIVVVNSWSYLFSGAISLTIPFSYFYVTALWKVSMIVSVVEEGVSGFKAIGRAIEVMNGKRVQASLLMVPPVIAGAYVHHMVYALTDFHLRRNTWLAMVIYITRGSYCFLTIFMLVVYTVFYHERKTSLRKQEAKGHYHPIASDEV